VLWQVGSANGTKRPRGPTCPTSGLVVVNFGWWPNPVYFHSFNTNRTVPSGSVTSVAGHRSAGKDVGARQATSGRALVEFLLIVTACTPCKWRSKHRRSRQTLNGPVSELCASRGLPQLRRPTY